MHRRKFAQLTHSDAIEVNLPAFSAPVTAPCFDPNRSFLR